MSEWGGRAMCPVEEYNDPAIREEMTWHAIEQALADRWGEPYLRRLCSTAATLRVRMTELMPPLGQTRMLQTHSGTLTIRASTDEHLGEDSSGLVDLTCTLTPA